jgi:hypothetical protein
MIGLRRRLPTLRPAAAALLAAGAVAAAWPGAAQAPPAPAGWASGSPPPGAGTPVVFVTFDEFPISSILGPGGRIDARRFPNFAAFARTSTWFRTTTAVADGTRWATPAVIASRYPRKPAMPAWTDYSPNLFTALGRSHALHVEEPMTRLCPPRLCGGPPLRGRTRGERARALTALIPRAKEEATRRSPLAEFVAEIGPWRRGRPPLYFIDVLLPHHPWRWLPDGRSYALPRPAIPGLYGDNMWRDAPRLVDQGWRRHLLQTGYADLLLGRLVAQLRAAGLWDRAVVAFVADHGVSFLPGRSRRSATAATVGGIAPVPFFVKAPRQRKARRVDAHVHTVDVLPTVLDAARLPIPRGLQGRSALDPTFRSRPRVELWSTTSVRGFRRNVFSLAHVRRESARVVARQLARFGTGRMTGPRWRPLR